MLSAVRSYWRLARWLGPWADDARSPRAVARRRILIEAQGGGHAPIDALVYTPTDRRPIGSYLLVHGLNPRGPEDIRCDRFARILSHAGFVVMCPRLDALTQMRLDAGAVAQLCASLEALVALEEHPRDKLPGIFSISFGSFPALMTAASPGAGPLIGGLIVFGGYADFAETCRFMMGTASRRSSEPEPDPTCMAGLAINTVAVLFEEQEGRLLAQAWREFVSRVWGMPGMGHAEQFAAVAHQLAAGLPTPIRQVFLQGCGVVPGFAVLAEKALALIDVQSMDPRRFLNAIRCPVHLFHGRFDDVIPYSQMQALAAGLTNADPKTYLTGLYDHSRRESGAFALAQVPVLLKETKTLAAMVRAMVVSGSQRCAAKR